MRFYFLINVIVLVILPVIAHAQTASWKAYQSQDGFEVQYPDTLTVKQATGSDCVKTPDKPEPVCGFSKSFSLNGVSVDGKNNSISFFVQSGKNPKQLSIEEWYQSQPVNPAKTDIKIDGKPAVHIEHAGKFGTIHMVYIPINVTDILTITYTSTNPQFDEIYHSILSTIKFSQPIK
jgi:hypothetical protein